MCGAVSPHIKINSRPYGGINYDSQYTMTKNSDGTLTVKVPYIKWTNQTGRLAFYKTTVVRAENIAAVTKMFEENTLYLDDTSILTDYL